MPPLLGKGSTGSASSGQRTRLLNKESRLSGAVRPGRRRGVGVGSLTVADVLARRESSRDCAEGWGTGGLGSIQNSPAPFQTGNQSGIQRDPGRPRCAGPAAELRGAGVGRPQAGPVLEAQPVHLRGLENRHPWGGKRRWDFSWGRNRTLPAGDNGSRSLHNSTPVAEGTQHPGDRRVKSALGQRVLI